MNMANVERRHNGGDGPAKDPDKPTVLPIVPIIQQRKHWAKKYRTEIAASGSSVLSTFVAVSSIRVREVLTAMLIIDVSNSTPWTLSRLACRRMGSLLLH